MADNAVVNEFLDKILSPVFALMDWLIQALFSNQIVILILYLFLISLIAILLMKKDKEYAEKR